MSSGLLIVLWLTTGGALADPETPDTVELAVSDDPAQRLDDGRRTYLLGDAALARTLLEALVVRASTIGDVPWQVEAEALVYLGEIQYLAGERDAAGASFRLVLERDPNFRISPYDHPLDVVGAFELIRTSVQDERTAAAAVRVPMPWWGYAPFGAPQFRSGRPVRGAVYAGLQLGFAAASVGAWVAIDQQSRVVTGRDLGDGVNEAAAERARLFRDAWSIPAAAAFYVTWSASVIDSGVTWRKDRLASFGASVAPRAGGLELAITGRF